MVRTIQAINNSNKDAILSRYQALGWGLEHLRGRDDQLLELYLVWPHETPPEYPDISDLM